MNAGYCRSQWICGTRSFTCPRKLSTGLGATATGAAGVGGTRVSQRSWDRAFCTCDGSVSPGTPPPMHSLLISPPLRCRVTTPPFQCLMTTSPLHDFATTFSMQCLVPPPSVANIVRRHAYSRAAMQCIAQLRCEQCTISRNYEVVWSCGCWQHERTTGQPFGCRIF